MYNATVVSPVLDARQSALLECDCIEAYQAYDLDPVTNSWVYFAALRSQFIARTSYSVELVYESNYAAMQALYPGLVNCNGELDNETLESYSDDEFAAVLDTFKRLSDYPLVDEDLHSEMEWELQAEAKEDCFGYVESAIEGSLDNSAEIDADLARGLFETVWESHWSNGRCHEECGSWYYDEKAIVADVNKAYFAEVEKNHLLDIFTGDSE